MKMFIGYLLDKRYVVVVASVLVLVAGFFAYQKLPMEAFPDVANLQVRVITTVPGKAAEEVERLVTVPLEKEMNGIPHSNPPRSVSIFGLSVITVVFDDNTDMYVARQQVLERIAHADLPESIKPELDPNASPVGEIFRYTVEGKHWTAMERKEVQDWLLTRLFKSIDGIIDSTSFGGPTRTYLVELDPVRLRAMGLTQDQVAQALSKSNDSTGGSYIVRNDQRYMVRGLGLLQSINDIKSVVIASSADGVPVRIKDVALVSIAEAVRKGQVGLDDDDDAVEGILMMRRGDNPSRVVARLKKYWPVIEQSLPAGMYLRPVYDRTALVQKTVNTIGRNVLEGSIFVVMLLVLFLFQVRSALICAFIIPFSLMFAFLLLTFLDIPANLLSLGAIDFGIIVDGAVIMVENIGKKLAKLASNEKSAVRKAIIEGCAEVYQPILFSTMIILLSFLPVLTLEHVEGRLFRPLAILMSFNLIGAVTATLLAVPVLAYVMYSKQPLIERESILAVTLERTYRYCLRRFLPRTKLIIICSASLLICASVIFPFIGSEFVPELEEGNIWVTVNVLPASVALSKSVEIAGKLRRIIKTYPEVSQVLTQVGAPDDGTDPNPYNVIQVLINLKSKEKWRSAFAAKEDLISAMSKELNAELPGLICNFSQYIKDNMDEAMSGVKGQFAVKIFGPDLEILESTAGNIVRILSAVPGFVDISRDILTGQPQILITIDQERASRYGVTADDVLNVVETSIGGKVITTIIEGEKRFSLVLRLHSAYREKTKDLGEILVSTPVGQRIPLKQLASITQEVGAHAIARESNRRRIAVYGNIRGRDLGSAVNDAQAHIKNLLPVPEGYSISYAGEYERAKEAAARLGLVVPLTFGAVFMLLYFMFDSALCALLAMSSLPVALACGIVALYLGGAHLSISSGVGFIALFGLSIQNNVIMLSKILTLIKTGTAKLEAIETGAVAKMRPILLAALVAAVGLLPAALSSGIGAQSQRPFAIVIAGALVPSTLITFLLLPVLCRCFLPDRFVPDRKEKFTSSKPS